MKTPNLLSQIIKYLWSSSPISVPHRPLDELRLISFAEISEILNRETWIFFGKKQVVCTGFTKQDRRYYQKHGNLPPICRNCYKALLFWDNDFNMENLHRLIDALKTLPYDVGGKFNDSVTVFYFDYKTEMEYFLDDLNEVVEGFSVSGRTSWRRACKDYQQLQPTWWKNPRKFIPLAERDEITTAVQQSNT